MEIKMLKFSLFMVVFFLSCLFFLMTLLNINNPTSMGLFALNTVVTLYLYNNDWTDKGGDK